MIRTEWLKDEEVVAVRPEGPIDDEDFAIVAKVVDPVIERRGRLEGLLLDARGFRGWDDTRALMAHLKFVHAHQPKVARIAVVGDQWWLAAAAAIEPFTGMPVRVFAADGEGPAKAWLLESAPEPQPVAILPDSAGTLVGVRVTGRLRDADYRWLQAELSERLAGEGRIRLLAVIEEGFRGWTPKACLDDVAMAFSPWRGRLEKLAVVAGPGFVRWCTEHFPAALLPYPVKVFGPHEVDAAWDWLRS